ncbi:MAG TPA: transcription termination factor NusA [Candidatus Eisenbacteria bacterium]|nr:transcription termination factor NusA [Candidatus Eisenbacteria bacterium]
MAAVQRSEFYLALNQVATERGVEMSVVLDAIENAILAAYKKDHPGTEVEDYTVKINQNTGEARVIHGKDDVTPPGFGRIAAQTAKQVILQKVREKEKEAVLADFSTKIGTIMNGTVLRFAGPNVIVDLGKSEAIMPPNEQVAVERYHQNQRLSFYIVEIREGLKGQELVVSRAHNGLLEGLFKREVPEIAQGNVVIKTMVREPGSRSKIAVAATAPGIDPVGSCVGQKGVRVQAIIQEFGGLEKIDIIQWSDDVKTFIASSLSPAKDLQINLDEESKTATVITPKDQLSIAIGKEGQNARLASKLTGWRIEIKESDAPVAEVKVEEVKTEEPKEEVANETKEPEEPKEESSDVILGNEVTPESKEETTEDAGQASMTVPEATKETEEPEAPKEEVSVEEKA